MPTNRWFNDFVGNDPTGRAAVCGWGFLSCSWGLLVSGGLLVSRGIIGVGSYFVEKELTYVA